jgi:hypothetical protein
MTGRTFEGGFDRNLLTICPIGGMGTQRGSAKALFRSASGTIVFVTNWRQ